MSVSDARSGVQTVLAGLPMLITIGNGFTGMIPGLQPFDISQIPHAQLATRTSLPQRQRRQRRRQDVPPRAANERGVVKFLASQERKRLEER